MKNFQITVKALEGPNETTVYGATVQECIDNLKQYHTFKQWHHDYLLTEKGEERLKAERESGWWMAFEV